MIPEEETDLITRDPEVVYPVDFITEEYCTSFESFTMSDFSACLQFAQYEIFISYLSLFFGIIVGLMLAKAVADGWT